MFTKKIFTFKVNKLFKYKKIGLINMNFNLKFGDMLYRTKSIVEHCGIYINKNEVLHNSPNGDTSIVSIEEFAQGKKIKIKRVELKDKEELVKRLKKIIQNDKQYNPLFNNCEQIANQLLHGEPFSPQVRSAVTGAIAMRVLCSGLGPWGLILGGVLGLALNNSTQKYDGEIAPNK